jgi:molybdate transport system regulatory protein
VKTARSPHPRADVRFQIRPRLYRGRDIAFGPGKADLLDAIARTGSITTAAASLEMSYMRAWTLIQTMNRCFRQPLVTTRRGGAQRGAAQLTETGRAVLTLYRRFETQSLKATQTVRRQLTRCLR